MEEKLHFDVAIIGASSSGLFAAARLAKSGKKVAIFERERQINPARRTYIITPHLQKVYGDFPEELVAHRIHTIAVEGTRSQKEIRLRQPDLIIERNQLIRYLAHHAQEAGVALCLGHRMDGFVQVGSETFLKLHTDGGEIRVRAGAVIGADGAYSVVAKSAGVTLPEPVPLIQAEIQLPDEWNPGLTKVWFNVEDTRFFYWLIPESESRAVVGLIGDEGSDIRSLLDRFLAAHQFEAITYQAGKAAMHRPGLRPWGQIGDLPIYLIGDAASQVKVTTVGGTVSGFWGASAAVDSILSGANYQRHLQRLNRELNIHWFIRWMLERMDNSDYSRLMDYINPVVMEFLAHRNRDQMANAFFRIIFLQPRFIILGARLLVRWLFQNLRRLTRPMSPTQEPSD